MAVDWQPVAAALAGFIMLQGPAVANLIVTVANRKKLDQVHQNTNGSLKEACDEVVRLAEANAALQAKLDKVLRPPGPV